MLNMLGIFSLYNDVDAEYIICCKKTASAKLRLKLCSFTVKPTISVRYGKHKKNVNNGRI